MYEIYNYDGKKKFYPFNAPSPSLFLIFNLLYNLSIIIKKNLVNSNFLYSLIL